MEDQHSMLSEATLILGRESSSQPKNTETKQHAQLFSILSGVTIISLIGVVIYVLLFGASDSYGFQTIQHLTVVGISLLFYWLNRSGHTNWAIAGYLIGITIISLAFPFMGDEPRISPFVVIPMFLAGMFYSLKWTIRYISIILFILFALNAFYSNNLVQDNRLLWYFIIVSSVLILVSKYHLTQIRFTHHQQLDEINAQLLATLRAIPDLLLDIDKNGILRDYRVPKGKEPFVPLQHFIGGPIDYLFPEAAIDNIRMAMKTTSQTERFAVVTIQHDLHWFEMTVSAKDTSGFIGILRDITERQQAEALRTERTRLELELEKEKELTQLRSQFISTISHEFRTPLSVIMSSASMLDDYNEKLSREERNKKIQQIVDEVKRLDTMIEEVSVLSKSQQGFLIHQPEETDVVAFCEQLVEGLQAIARPEQKLVFKPQGIIDLAELDVNLLRHILVNLLSNGIKYSPNSKPVTLELMQQDSQLVFVVTDNGIGIPEDDLKQLFDPFYRAGNVGKIGGSGLGLSIVKEAVDLQGGTITCNSEVNVGTTFTVNIPLRPSD